MSELTSRARDQAASAGQAGETPGDRPAAGEAGIDDAVVRRTKDGWRVGDSDLPDLTSAMVLADLISAELAQPGAAVLAPASDATYSAAGTTATAGDAAGAARKAATADTVMAAAASAGGETTSSGGTKGSGTKGSGTKGKGKSKDPAASDTSKLRATIGQLEHALTARIRVEQAIGVLAERHRIQPRQAFEQLRTAARNRGRRVIDIASDVVASATNPLLQLPDELSRPRSGARQGRRGRQTPGVLSSE